MESNSRCRETAQLANCVLQPGFEGTTAPDWVRRRIAEGLHSVVLFGRNIVDAEQVARLNDSLRAENPDLIIAIDEEAGDVTRLEAWTGASRPGNLALGAVDDVELTEAVAYDIGSELRSVGVSLNYAPSADVNSNPRNPVIGVRSFGAETGAVARHTAAWVRGLQKAGVAACAKHFPGHGDTAVDSHHGLPQVTASAQEIAATALPPFTAAMEAGVRAVMTAHLLVPAYDAELPATLSRRILVDLLRDQLGFDGMVVTDAIEMGAVTERYGIDGATVRAVVNGVDAVCVGGEDAEESTFDLLSAALVKAVEGGTLDAERLAEAAGRVRHFAAWSASRTRAAEAAPGTGAVAGPQIGLVAARRAVRVLGASGSGSLLPLPDAPHVVELSPTMNLAIGGVTPWGVAAPLSELLPGTTSVRLTETELAETELAGADGLLERSTLAPAVGRPLVVVVRDAARHPWMEDAVHRMLRSRPDAVVVEMGVPNGLAPGAVHLLTHGATRVSGLAAAEVLAGRP
ncbi:glycoside hydrolase family 3 protein [Streptomyces sp. N2-109]|uniref:Glycoside hydrolase family 3 protein n=1 Tax=Streptomyces gossypii TaxID=2883101 RepID=A0ABT2JRI5_9ACTN|nr:glycoside hydrolase family 3 protein [Streptomyces gossypii]MCT2589960.1 glycoside hydrolase family 3 protein [Streptomyces gossypii]